MGSHVNKYEKQEAQGHWRLFGHLPDRNKLDVYSNHVATSKLAKASNPNFDIIFEGQNDVRQGMK